MGEDENVYVGLAEHVLPQNSCDEILSEIFETDWEKRLGYFLMMFKEAGRCAAELKTLFSNRFDLSTFVEARLVLSLVNKLDADSFAVRQKAKKDLQKLVDDFPFFMKLLFEKILQDPVSIETRESIRSLLGDEERYIKEKIILDALSYHLPEAAGQLDQIRSLPDLSPSLRERIASYFE